MDRELDTGRTPRQASNRVPLGVGLVVLALSVGAPPAPCAAADLEGRFSTHAPLEPGERPDEPIAFSSTRGPRIHGALSDRSIRNLRLGYVLALETVRSTPACDRLFASLGASGVESLTSMSYAAPMGAPGARACTGGVAAFTTVGGHVTWLCPQFGSLHPRVAALTLIHEALHGAEMPESPPFAGALTAQQISDMVEGVCAPGPGSRGGGKVVAGRR